MNDSILGNHLSTAGEAGFQYNEGMRNPLASLGGSAHSTLKKVSEPLRRLVFFFLYFWTGLSILMKSWPALELFTHLYTKSFLAEVPFLTPSLFLILYGGLAMISGILFLFPRSESNKVWTQLTLLVTSSFALALADSLLWSKHLELSTLGWLGIFWSAFIILGLASSERRWR